MLRELADVGVGNHATDVVADNVDFVHDLEVLRDELVEVLRQGFLSEWVLMVRVAHRLAAKAVTGLVGAMTR